MQKCNRNAKSIGSYIFNDRSILESALSHPSASSVRPSSGVHGFQRLEFMGDSVLNLVITDVLMHVFPNEGEGPLSKRRAALVSRETCHKVGNLLGICECMQVGANVDLVNSSILADAVEAIIGAMYVDSGKNMGICRAWIMEQWQKFIETSNNVNSPPVDPKTALQELAQMYKMPCPVYTELSRTGPDHDLRLKVSVDLPGSNITATIGEGRTKKAAEKLAASKMLEMLGKLQMRDVYDHKL